MYVLGLSVLCLMTHVCLTVDSGVIVECNMSSEKDEEMRYYTCSCHLSDKDVGCTFHVDIGPTTHPNGQQMLRAQAIRCLVHFYCYIP